MYAIMNVCVCCACNYECMCVCVCVCVLYIIYYVNTHALILRSMKIGQITYRYPILLDAATAAVARKGDRFLARWADIMTGRVPKIHLLSPEFVTVITFELIMLLLKRLFGMKQSREEAKEKAA